MKKLLPYQVEGAKRLRSLRRGILADDMGLGKTRQSIAAAAVPHELGQRNLIITLNGLQTNWKREIEALLGAGQDIEVYDGKMVQAASRWVIIHYEAAKLPRNYERLISDRWSTVIVDEAHHCKTRKSRTKKGSVTNYGLVDMLSKRCERLFLLTGTPMRQSPADLWPLLHFIDRKRYSSFWRWVERYVIYEQGYFGRKPTGYQNLDLLAEELQPYAIRRTKAEVIDQLPPKNVHTIYCSMGRAQAKLYNQMVEHYVAELSSGVYMSAPTEVSKLMRLRQIATDPSIMTDEMNRPGKYLPSCKVEVLSDLVKRIVFDEDEKVIIFSNWSSMVYRLEDALKDLDCDCLVYTGDTPKHERQSIVDRFQTDPAARIFIGTIGAAGTGLTLTAARKVIFTDRAWTPDDNAQAEDRAYARMNDLHGVDVYKLITEGTVDESIDRYIEEKGDTVEQVIGRIRSELTRS